MTPAQLILVSVTSAIVAVFAMLVVATILRRRMRDEAELSQPETEGETEGGPAAAGEGEKTGG
jgi:ABC-type bacteriocin/lantibiotic exporter with double-glycine peptidase domain